MKKAHNRKGCKYVEKCIHPKWELCVHRPNAYDNIYYKKCVLCGHVEYLDEKVIIGMKYSSRYAW